ncbi:hypothetical protein [Actinokineospora globicatena]|uniref:Uncharacterized protein n=1 Tax=Actinokineospora globicatena TaxID=103729 RepID=A0A9W6QWE0_9PSEU|nr:hypothetical protein [Actinokineospora globicatena]GLW95834.1 hypothetical protein Aglo03_66500 [Actinokineospora globicatena]
MENRLLDLASMVNRRGARIAGVLSLVVDEAHRVDLAPTGVPIWGVLSVGVDGGPSRGLGADGERRDERDGVRLAEDQRQPGVASVYALTSPMPSTCVSASATPRL